VGPHATVLLSMVDEMSRSECAIRVTRDEVGDHTWSRGDAEDDEACRDGEGEGIDLLREKGGWGGGGADRSTFLTLETRVMVSS